MARRITLWKQLLPLCAAIEVFGCAAPTLQNGVFRQGELAFRVGPVPEHWKPLDEEQPDSEMAVFAFRDSRDLTTISVAARCHRDGDDVPLRALTQHLYIGFTDREMRSEKEFMLDGRAALRTEMVASLDGVPKDMTFVVLKKDGCVYDFWRIAPLASPTPEFDAFVGGFQVLEP